MLRSWHLPSATPTSVRYLALLLLVLQGFVAASPLFEGRNVDGPPRVHVEQRDAHHPDQHNEASCALCSVRATSMVASVPLRPISEGQGRSIVRAAGMAVAVASDAGLDHHSRAPPVIAS